MKSYCKICSSWSLLSFFTESSSSSCYFILFWILKVETFFDNSYTFYQFSFSSICLFPISALCRNLHHKLKNSSIERLSKCLGGSLQVLQFTCTLLRLQLTVAKAKTARRSLNYWTLTLWMQYKTIDSEARPRYIIPFYIF